MTKKQRAAAVEVLLQDVFPGAECALHYTQDFELLFATRLSAQCTDIRVNIVTKDLFARFPTLQDYADAPLGDIESSIKTCGLYHTKARDLQAAAHMLLEEFGGKVPDTMEDLLRLPGIGRKTANLILGDIYGKPAIVCDTHCIRLSNRLGFVKNEKDAYKVEMALKKILTHATSNDFCHRLVLHGRETCTARSPKCVGCCLAEVCPSFAKA